MKPDHLCNPKDESPSSDEADPKIVALRKVYDEELKEVKQKLLTLESRLSNLEGKDQKTSTTFPTGVMYPTEKCKCFVCGMEFTGIHVCFPKL